MCIVVACLVRRATGKRCVYVCVCAAERSGIGNGPAANGLLVDTFCARVVASGSGDKKPRLVIFTVVAQ